MEHGSRFVVSHGSVVRLLDPARGEGCFKSCMCSTSGDLRSCVDLPCTDEPKDCRLAGQLRSKSIKSTLPLAYRTTKSACYEAIMAATTNHNRFNQRKFKTWSVIKRPIMLAEKVCKLMGLY